MINKLKNIIDKRFILLLTLSGFLVLLTSALIFFLNDQITLYGDARSRLLIARGVFDSLTPGLVQFGGVWPPIPQTFYIPTVWNNYLLYSGLSGMIVSLLFGNLAILFLSKLLYLISKNKIATLIGIIAFTANPSFLYMSSVPMSEVPFISFVIMSTYFLYRWLTEKKVIFIPLAAFTALLASWTRYEGYFLPFFSIILIVSVAWFNRDKFNNIVGYVILYSTLAVAGIFLWLLFNQIIFGNFIHFVSGETASFSRAAGENSGELTKGHVVNTLLAYLDGSKLIAGLASTLLIIPAIILSFTKARRNFLIPFFMFSSPIIFVIISLYTGSADIFTFRNANFLYNVRLGLLVLPLIGLSYTLLSTWKFTKFIVMIILIIQIIILFQTQPIPLQEAYNSSNSGRGVAQKSLASWLKTNPTNGLTFISYTINQTVIFDARIDTGTVISQGTGKYWDQAFEVPQESAKRVIISMVEGDVIWEKSEKKKDYLKDYKKTYENEYFRVYDLN